MTALKLQEIKAVPHPCGNRIDLQWLNPQPHLFKGVRVRRREFTYPTPGEKGNQFVNVENAWLFTITIGPDTELLLDNKTLPLELTTKFLDSGVVLSNQSKISILAPGNQWQVTHNKQIYLIIKNNNQLEVYGMSTLEDRNLRAEVVYYYTLYPYKDDPEECLFHRSNRISAVATAPYDFAGQMHRMLPIIYHRYDTALPLEKYKEKVSQQDMKRGQLRRFLDLPGSQLDQLYSFATAILNFHDISGVDGKLLPLLARWIGWDTDHNLEIAQQRNELKNAPSLYKTIGTIPAAEAAIAKCIPNWDCRTKEFIHNIFLSNRPEQLNLWLCQKNKDGEWEESNDVFSLDFAYQGRPAAAKDEQGNIWLFYHTLRNNKWDIWYKTRRQEQPEEKPEEKPEKKPEEQKWTPSQPLTGADTIDKYPTAVFQGNTLWLAWDSFNIETQTWTIKYRSRTNGQWSKTSPFYDEKNSGSNKQCRGLQAVVDNNGHLWLFWWEKIDGAAPWQMKYNRYDGNDQEKLNLNLSLEFPLDEGKQPRVEKDLFVLFHEAAIWVFWARKRYRGDDNQRYWEIAFRKKTGIESIQEGWGPVRVLSKIKPGGNYHDCEPAAVIDADNEIELYWASGRSGSWSVWNCKLSDLTGSEPQADTAVMLIDNPYSQRTPLPLLIKNSISVVYRSNQGISYANDVYRSTVTTDFRNAGSTTVDTRNEARLASMGKYDDFQAYTYDVGENGGKPTNDDWYARDSIGIYLVPDTEDKRLIARKQEFINGILEGFLPIQTRVIFIIDSRVYKESVYPSGKKIEEEFSDNCIIPATEIITGPVDKYQDKAPDWIWIHSSCEDCEKYEEYKNKHRTVNFDASPIDTSHRTWHIGIKKNGKDEIK